MGGVPRNEPSRTGTRTDGLVSISGNACAVCNTVLDAEGGLLTGVADRYYRVTGRRGGKPFPLHI